MPRRALLLLLCAAAATLGGRRAVAGPLPSDPTLVRGELENGLKYVVRRHAQPPGRAALWLHIGSGSLNETERQRGVAHYLEHMAFNGSKNFPPGSLVPFFQSLGLTFGRDQNAFTSFDQTTYQLALPDAKPETMAKGMTYFADVLHRLLLAPKEIEAERQIIQEERRRGLSGRQRVRDHVLERIAPGSLVARRLPIGTEESINGLAEKDFRDYYGTWYTASNATMLVVADADPAVVVEAIRAAFSDAPRGPAAKPQDPGVKAYESSFAIVASDPEIESAEVRITRVEPARPPTTTEEGLRDDLVIGLAEAAFNRRLEDKVARGGTPFLGARLSWGGQGRLYHSWELSARAPDGGWKPALEGVALELQRARRHGFGEREVEDAKKEFLSRAERDVETDATRPAQAVLMRLNRALVSGDTILSAAQELEILRAALPTITREEIAKRFASEVDPRAVAFVAVLPAGPGVPAEAALLEAGVKALAVEPPAEGETARPTKLMADLPKPGEVERSEEHAATGVSTTWFRNHVVLHHRFLDTRKNEVAVEIALLGGEMLETAENRGVTAAAQLAWRTPATKSLSSSDIRSLLAGRKTSVGAGGQGGGGRGGRGGRGGAAGGVGAASISLSVSGSPADLEAGLQLAHLLLVEPRIEATAFSEYRTTTAQALAEAARNPMALGMRAAAGAPYPEGDARLQPLTSAQLDRLTLAGAQAWLDRLVRESPIEVCVVGDLPRERAVELVARYVGSLPERTASGPDLWLDRRRLDRPEGPRRIERTAETETAQAFVLSGFYGPDERDRPQVRAMIGAAQILSTRLMMEIREKKQLVYSIGAGFRPGGTYPGFGVLSAGAPTEPHKVPALVDALAAVYAEFAASGPTEEEMAVARKQAATTFEEQLKEPSYWLARLSLLEFRGLKLDDVAADPAAYQALTAAQVKDVFAKHYAKDRTITVVVQPKASLPAPPPKGPPDAPK